MRLPRDWQKWATVLACILPFLGFWATGLTDLDEGYYGAVVANMLRTGDWITPVFNDNPWFEKPVLAYWLAAPSVAVFGHEFGPRLPSVLCTLATAFVLFRFIKKHIDITTARIVAVAYCSSILVAAIGRMLLTDAPFVLAMTLALTTFYESINGKPAMRVWSGVALGVAVLAKGPVAGILFTLVALFTYWRMPDLRKNFDGYWVPGIALFFAVVATWYVPAYLANREVFVEQFLIEQNIGRFQGGDLAHKTPAWMIPIYFPVILLLALIPWSVWAPKSKWFAWPQDHFMRYIWIWGLVVLCFFSASLTKLPHYILPAVAPFTVITVVAVLQRRTDSAKPDFWLKCAVAWSIIVFSFTTIGFKLDYDNRFAEAHKIARYLRDKEGEVVLFSVGRTERETSMQLSVRQSALPSFFFYLEREGTMTHMSYRVAIMDGPVWLVVEKGAMDEKLIHRFALVEKRVEPHELPFDTKRFEVFYLRPKA
jgi:4-amino-4-deoxy-L-arabinose transferase-like glycosyltransferase